MLPSFRLNLAGTGSRPFCFPEIVAEVAFDTNVQDWVMRGQGVVTVALHLKNPNATDGEILAETFTFATVYRHRIIRSKA